MQEREELLIKLEKLNHFRYTAKVKERDAYLLSVQSSIMSEYLRVLDLRIERINSEKR